jgi:hypothetical protein
MGVGTFLIPRSFACCRPDADRASTHQIVCRTIVPACHEYNTRSLCLTLPMYRSPEEGTEEACSGKLAEPAAFDLIDVLASSCMRSLHTCHTTTAEGA